MKFEIRDRAFYEKLEQDNLAPYATRSREAQATRIHNEAEHPYRTAFQRDRDRIIHSRAFRRLKHKQQVFLISEGDHYRTRITHTMEVSQLSRTMTKALGLNEELGEAIALGHDLGHTPFGHIGEVVLHGILAGQDDLNGLLAGENLGGFKHNYQSLRVVDLVEKKYEFDGLNLTAYVREGILKHTRLLRNNYNYPDFIYQGLHFEHDAATTLEGQVVAICDEVAQRTHDLEDGIRGGLVELEDIRKVEIIGIVEKSYGLEDWLKKDRYTYRNKVIRALINFLIDDVIHATLKNIQHFYQRKKRLYFFDEEIVKFSNWLDPLQLALDSFISQEIIAKARGNDINNINKNIIRTLYRGFVENPALLPEYIFRRIMKLEYKVKADWNPQEGAKDAHSLRLIADYVASMTDHFAALEFERHNFGEK